MVILHELWGICWQRVHHASGKGIRSVAVILRALGIELLAQGMAVVGIIVGVEIPVGVHAAHVIHGSGDRCLDAGVDGCGIDCHAAPAANAEDADAFRVNVLPGGEVVHGGAEVLRIDVRRRHITGLPAAFTGEGRVEGKGQETPLCQFLCVQSRCLLLYCAEWTADGDGWQFPLRVQRHVQIGGKRDAVPVVESHFAVFYLFALREHLVPLLR